MGLIRVLIADDHASFRNGLRRLLRLFPEIEVVGEAVSGAAALQQTTLLQPDIILMDVQMPDGNGIDATAEILRMSPHIGVLMLTMFEDDDSVFDFFYDHMPLRKSKFVNGPSYKSWHLTLPVMSNLYRLSN